MRRCLISLALLLLFAACESNTDKRVTTLDMGAHRWLFYYQANVYFCPDHRHYWYLSPADRRWVETDKLERHIDTSYKPYTVINEASNFPYQNHRKHEREAREQAARLKSP